MLAACGFDPTKQYSTRVLYRLVASLVERTGWGCYRILRRHPELAALRRAAVAEAERAGRAHGAQGGRRGCADTERGRALAAAAA